MKYFIVFILLSLFLFTNLSNLYGEETVDNLNNKILEYTQRLDELAKSKDTLSTQVKILNSQVELTTLKINQTEISIKQLEAEISSLTVKIDQLDISLNQLSSLYIQQVTQNYKLKKYYPSIAIFASSNFNQFLEQFRYISNIQKNSQNTLLNMETTRTNFDNQKAQKKLKQTELEQLEKKLADQKLSLAKQKDTKTNLLEITKNNENKYQQLKKAAEDELNSLLKAKFVGKRSVKAGEPLGIMGNTGYSFGDHLHFGLYNLKEDDLNSWSYANDIDSSDYLKNHMWPMNEPIEITQTRGVTKYSYLYSDHYHHGVDMVSPTKTIKAVNDGVAYFFRNASSSLGNHIKVFHPDGKMTLYLHLQ